MIIINLTTLVKRKKTENSMIIKGFRILFFAC